MPHRIGAENAAGVSNDIRLQQGANKLIIEQEREGDEERGEGETE